MDLGISVCVPPDSLYSVTRPVAKLSVGHVTSKQLRDIIEYFKNSTTITSLTIDCEQLTDDDAFEIVENVNPRLKSLCLASRDIDTRTFLAVADILCIDASLEYLVLHGSAFVDHARIDAAFVYALHINPRHSTSCRWFLNTFNNSYPRLHAIAERLGAPSMLAQFAIAIQ